MALPKDAVAVVTGATSGIGVAVARTFHAQQIRMVLHGRNVDKLEAISGETGSVFVLGDITDPDIPQNMLDTALTHYDGCDIVVNNAGIITTGTVDEIDIDKVCEMVRVNVEGAFRVIHLFAKYFKNREAGHIVNISSVLGTKVRETAGAYAATKYAIEALSEALRMELARTNVHITCIEPGLVKTDLHRDYDEHPSVTMNVPHPLEPEDVADAVLSTLRQKDRLTVTKLMVLPKDYPM